MLLLFPGIHVVDSVISPIEVYYSRQAEKVGSAFNARAFFFGIQISISLQRSPLVSISITAWQIVLCLFAHVSNMEAAFCHFLFPD